MSQAWDSKTAYNIALWLNGDYNEETKQAVRRLIEQNPQEAADAFYTNLSFGTGGMRGLMGVGTNRINNYTIQTTTQGLANYIQKQPIPPQGHSVFIGFDSRHHSSDFAQESAKVLAANGIKVYLCKDFRPTPLISFGCRLKKCSAAIMITASHNPPKYNGYKVYGNDGGQVLPEHSLSIISEIEKITNPSQVKKVPDIQDPLITLVSDEIDKAYLQAGFNLQNYPDDNQRFGQDLKIVYTSLHGTGITLVPRMLSSWGFSNVAYVDAQVIPDGNFPTIKSPNPEDSSALAMGLERLQATHSDILIANDPDADRIGIAIWHKGEAVILSGNQVACLCLEHICSAMKERIPANASFIKTIVTTELFQAICDHYKVDCFNVPIGSKYMAEMISGWSNRQFIFGAEDSCGYLYGTVTRDKDGLIPSALIAEIALKAKREGKTLVDRLQELYQKYGIFFEEVMAIHFEDTKAGREQMEKKLAGFKSHPPKEINGLEVVAWEGYGDALLGRLVDGSKLVVRPSGTEPKIKLYCGVVNSSKEKAHQLLTSLKMIFYPH